MIKHHPKFELLQSYVEGELPASLAAGVAIHAELCTTCQQTIAQLTEQLAEMTFELNEDETQLMNNETSNELLDFDAIIEEITASEQRFVATKEAEKQVSFKQQSYVLPRALCNMPISSSMQLGKLERKRLQLNENEIHTSLLHIAPGGGVPKHTHKGFELTVLLDGSFDDEHGHYVKGDFILLDGSVEHNPISAQGCLCYTVANDALHFTQGINKLLNPIGSFIY